MRHNLLWGGGGLHPPTETGTQAAHPPLMGAARLKRELRGSSSSPRRSDEDHLDLVLQVLDLGVQLGTLLRRDGAGDDGARDAAGAAEGGLGLHKDVRHVLVLAHKRQVEQNLQGLRVGGEDDELGGAAVERLGRLVRALLQLLVVGRLLHQIQDGDGQVLLGQRVGLRVHFFLVSHCKRGSAAAATVAAPGRGGAGGTASA
mmetsp:Transcript_21544/g.48030  ORF Transcript_21544/g.48030 Transcript_21544/m.48030 type:complete len:202 (-) Transcript_21544:14-619(-)